MTAYDNLQNTVNTLTGELKALQEKLSALNSDTYFPKMAGILDRTASNEWISDDGDGVKWAGPDAQAIHTSVAAAVKDWRDNISKTGAQVNDKKSQVAAAQTALTNYEATSPVLQKALSTASQVAIDVEANRKKIIVYSAIGILLIILIFGTYKLISIRKKSKPVAVAA